MPKKKKTATTSLDSTHPLAVVATPPSPLPPAPVDAQVEIRTIPLFPAQVPVSQPNEILLELYDCHVPSRITDPNPKVEQARRHIYRRSFIDYISKQISNLTPSALSSPDMVYSLYVSALNNIGLTL